MQIVGNEELIDILSKEVNNETIRNAKDVSLNIKKYWNAKRKNTRNNANASQERESNDRDGIVYNRQQSERAGDNFESNRNTRQSAKRTSDDGIKPRFSLSSPVERTKNLIAVHNLREDKVSNGQKIALLKTNLFIHIIQNLANKANRQNLYLLSKRKLFSLIMPLSYYMEIIKYPLFHNRQGWRYTSEQQEVSES